MINIVTDFGADPTGSTDNATAFANCAAACAGKTVLFPSGTYLLGTSISWPNAEYVGESWPTIKRTAGYSGSAAAPFFLGSGGIIRNMAFDGNAGVVATHGASEINSGTTGTVTIIENVRISNFKNIGIASGGGELWIDNPYIDGTNTPSSGSYGIWAANSICNTNVRGGLIFNCYVSGIYGGGDTCLTGVHFKGNHRQTTPTGGGQIASGAAGTFRVIGCRIEGGNTFTSGIELDNSSWIVEGNHISGCPNYGIVLQGSGNHIVTGNTIKNCKYGIYVNTAQQNWNVSDNRCYDDQTTKTQLYGIFVNGSCNNYVLTNNNTQGNATGGVNNASSGAANKTNTGNI